MLVSVFNHDKFETWTIQIGFSYKYFYNKDFFKDYFHVGSLLIGREGELDFSLKILVGVFNHNRFET